MTPFQRRSNAYIQRMADDMRIRNFAASTIDSYTYHAPELLLPLRPARRAADSGAHSR